MHTAHEKGTRDLSPAARLSLVPAPHAILRLPFTQACGAMECGRHPTHLSGTPFSQIYGFDVQYSSRVVDHSRSVELTTCDGWFSVETAKTSQLDSSTCCSEDEWDSRASDDSGRHTEAYWKNCEKNLLFYCIEGFESFFILNIFFNEFV